VGQTWRQVGRLQGARGARAGLGPDEIARAGEGSVARMTARSPGRRLIFVRTKNTKGTKGPRARLHWGLFDRPRNKPLRGLFVPFVAFVRTRLLPWTLAAARSARRQALNMRSSRVEYLGNGARHQFLQAPISKYLITLGESEPAYLCSTKIGVRHRFFDEPIFVAEEPLWGNLIPASNFRCEGRPYKFTRSGEVISP
jgi:hypothetical protein